MLIDDLKEGNSGCCNYVKTEEEKVLEARLNALYYMDKNIEKETEFVKHVMTRGQESSERKGLHASSIIKPEEDFCYRQQLLSLFYKQIQSENVPIKLKRIFSEGDAIHEKWQRLFIRGGLCGAKDCDNTLFSDVYDLQYTPDIICMIEKTKYIVEIKSMNTHAYQKMLREDGTHKSGRLQLYLYMYLTGIYNGFTLCEDKNTQDFTVRLYRYDKAVVKPFIERLDKIQKAKKMLIKKHRILYRKEDCSSYSCDRAKECPMRDICYKKSKERI